MVKVSIVVPVYNVEKYLAQCLNSLCKQTMKEIEIICVDDGSKDSSPNIIKKFQQKDNRVRCVSKQNSGYGNTMNMGMDAAEGEYIAIAESDDYIEPNTCEVLYGVAKQFDLDLVKSDYYEFYGDSGKSKYIQTCSEPSFYNKLIGYKKDDVVFEFRMNTWTGLYRTEFLRKNNIRHNETPGASYQDNGFWFQTVSLASRMMFIDKAFYHYRQDNPNSSINSKGKIYCMSDEYDFIHDFMVAHPDIYKAYFIPYFKRRFFNCMTTYKRVKNENKLLFLERFSSDLKRLLNTPGFSLRMLNDAWMESIVERVIDNYTLFYYEDLMYSYQQKKDQAEQKLQALRESAELKKGLRIKNFLVGKK